MTYASCCVWVGRGTSQVEITFSNDGLTALSGTVTDTDTVVEPPNEIERGVPSRELSCHPRSEPI